MYIPGSVVHMGVMQKEVRVCLISFHACGDKG